MAKRPVFLPELEGDLLVATHFVEFDWFPGLARSQKQKSIRSLHREVSTNLGLDEILEISSKSKQPLGVQLSAFNLTLNSPEGVTSSIESFFQGSKVFKNGGPFTDLYRASAREAKKDSRIQSSGPLIGFEYGGLPWGLEPKTAFYDWLYVNALLQHDNLASAVLDFDAFTDIEFNPKKSINCQAFSAALYCALKWRGLLDDAAQDRERFLQIYQSEEIYAGPSQASLFKSG